MRNIYEPTVSDKYRSFVFEDDLDDALEWKNSYAPLLLASFGAKLQSKLIPLAIVPNPDEKKKKFADISLLGSNSLLILSSKAYKCLKDRLCSSGQFVPLRTHSEEFIGFHVTCVINDAVIWERSKYREHDGARILYTPALKQSAVEAGYLFMLQESRTRIYASQDFYDACQEYKLSGIAWSNSKLIDVQ
ncbi:hypothetical protein [Pseudomonas sp. KB-10]|uniref:hypothetical protein n=1 Tax=Pseudomonas sp. KB-10 TaxID=2292264 RepID=UPI001BAFD90D|nr:hypothetical protein [Pseudomonas sp. KB-10]